MAPQEASSSTASSSSECDTPCCWICLEDDKAGELRQLCKCPGRFVHENCLARWQLHQAGRSEERACRFCNAVLQDWKQHMMPGNSSKTVTPYMRVSFNGKTHKVQVKPGEDGAKEFEAQIRRMLALPEDQEFDVIFHCRAPVTGDKLQLQGLCAYDAAVHCASMTSWPTAHGHNSESKHARRSSSGGGSKGGFMQRLVSRLAAKFDLAPSALA